MIAESAIGTMVSNDSLESQRPFRFTSVMGSGIAPLQHRPAGTGRRPIVMSSHPFSNLFSFTQALMSSRRNQMARPQRKGGLPAVKTICSSARIRSTS